MDEYSFYSKQKVNDPELLAFIKKDMQRLYNKHFLEMVTGPDIYGEGNFEIYLDEDNEWQIRPVKGWKVADLKGIINKEKR